MGKSSEHEFEIENQVFHFPPFLRARVEPNRIEFPQERKKKLKNKFFKKKWRNWSVFGWDIVLFTLLSSPFSQYIFFGC